MNVTYNCIFHQITLFQYNKRKKKRKEFYSFFGDLDNSNTGSYNRNRSEIMKKSQSTISKQLLCSIQKAIGFFLGIFLLLYIFPNIFLNLSEQKDLAGPLPSITNTIIVAVIVCVIAIGAIVLIQKSKKNCKDDISSSQSKGTDTAVKVLNNYIVGFKFWRVLLVVVIVLVLLVFALMIF